MRIFSTFQDGLLKKVITVLKHVRFLSRIHDPKDSPCFKTSPMLGSLISSPA